MGARAGLYTSRLELFLINIDRFSSGTYISLVVFPIMSMGASGDVGRRLGMFTSIISIGALTGPPISGAINSATGGYEAVGCYAGEHPFPFNSVYNSPPDMHPRVGSVIMLAVALMIVVRYLLSRDM
jgi:hypothetical protein